MKKLILLAALIFLSVFSFGQILQPNPMPNFQMFGSATTFTRVNGVLYPVVGFVNTEYADTASANANPYIRLAPGAQIRVGDSVYLRNFNATKWLNITGSGGVYTSSNGITLSGSNFKLGGNLTDLSTQINLNGNELVINGLNSTLFLGDVTPGNNTIINIDGEDLYLLNVPTAVNMTGKLVAVVNTSTDKIELISKDSIGGGGGSLFAVVGQDDDNTGLGSRFINMQGDSLRISNIAQGVLINGVTFGTGNMGDTENVAAGIRALMRNDNTTPGRGRANTAVGKETLSFMTTGVGNTAIGFRAMTYSPSQGTNFPYVNTYMGEGAGYVTRHWSQMNTGVGSKSIYNLLRGNYNTAIGQGSLRWMGQNSFNTAIGHTALSLTTSVIDSVIITNGGSGYTTATVSFGDPEGYNFTGDRIVATGTVTINAGVVIGIVMTNKGAPYTDSTIVTISGDGTGATGVVVLAAGEYNAGLGMQSLYSNSTGDNNTGAGYRSGFSNLTGSTNTFIGYKSGFYETRSNKLYVGTARTPDVGLASDTTTTAIYVNNDPTEGVKGWLNQETNIRGDLYFQKGSATNFGTRDNQNIILLTNNTTRGTLFQSGELVIGTGAALGTNRIFNVNGQSGYNGSMSIYGVSSIVWQSPSNLQNYLYADAGSHDGFIKAINIKNGSSGGSAGVGDLYNNNLNHFFQIFMGSSNSNFLPDGAILKSNGDGALMLAADSVASSPIRLSSSSSIAGTFGKFYQDSTFLPLRNAASAYLGFYNPTTKEITYYDTTGLFGVGGGTSYTFDNGLTLTGSNVQLGGTLIVNPTTIATGSNTLVVSTGTAAINPFNVTSTTGVGIQSTTTSGTAISGSSSTGTAGSFTTAGALTLGVYNTGNSTAIYGTSANKSLQIETNPAATNTVVTVADINRKTTGTAAAGIGGSIDFGIEVDNGTIPVANKIVSRLTNAASATPVAQMDILGLNTSEETFMNIQTGGIVRVNNNADTLATKAYARSVGGGGGGTIDGSGAAQRIAIWSDANTLGSIAGTEIYESGSTIIQNLTNSSGGIINLVSVSTGENYIGNPQNQPFNIYHFTTKSVGFESDGTIKQYGDNSGIVSIKIQADAGTYNFNLPTTAGTAGHLLTSQGGGTSAMTYTDPATFQPADAELTALAGVSANGVLAKTGAGTISARTITGTANKIDVTDGDGVAGNPTLNVGSDITQNTATQNLTNKRVSPRTGGTTSSATPTINTDNVDFYELTAQAVDITSFTTNLSGTPTNAQKLWIAITGTASRAITWGASFESSTATLPATTSGTSRLDVGFIWNTATSKWRCVAVQYLWIIVLLLPFLRRNLKSINQLNEAA